jgi:hypothetical protein
MQFRDFASRVDVVLLFEDIHAMMDMCLTSHHSQVIMTSQDKCTVPVLIFQPVYYYYYG